MQVTEFHDGYVILGDSVEDNSVGVFTYEHIGEVGLIIADPPYGNIVSEKWDRVGNNDDRFVGWMSSWTKGWATMLAPGGAFYIWGGIGKVGFRPFFKFLSQIEEPGKFELANLITWSKKRAYGVQNNYLFTREECAYFCNGDAKKPRIFNIPLLEQLRGYSGYNAEYPAKSDYLRRTNVWTDVSEIFKGKLHPTQKAQRVIEIPIEVHTNPGDWVVDPFAGAGTTAFACRKLGRKFVVVENDEVYYNDICKRLT